MTGDGRRVRRRTNLTILAVAAVALGLFIAGLELLTPPVQPLGPPVERQPGATCEQPRPREVPVAVASGTLFACPDAFDGRLVVVQGEAIGDLLRGPAGRRWVQVNDDAYADVGPLSSHFQPQGTNSGVAVLLPEGVAPAVLGGPGVRGDVLRVVGTFEVASAADQGGTAVIARTALVRRPGEVVGQPASPRLRVVTPIAVLLTLVLLAQIRRRAVAART